MVAPRMKWGGWGDAARTESYATRPALAAFLRRAIDLPLEIEPLPVPSPDAFPLPPIRLVDSDASHLRAIVGEEAADASAFARLTHTFGKSYRDLLRLRLGIVPLAPDLVMFPTGSGHIERILEFCSERDIAVIPFGGGTSVVGGVEVADAARPHVSLDLQRMREVPSVDGVSLTVTAEAGVIGPDLEARLAQEGLTAGHFPQSFEFSTLGGWIAARSSGALSNRYGDIEDLILALRLVTPTRTLDLRASPRHAMGPDLLSLAVGSEGILGVIPWATIRVHRAPETRKFETVLFSSFAEGLDSLRVMAQDEVPPDLAYLDDEDETRLSVAGGGGAKGAAFLRLRGVALEGAALCFLGYEGRGNLVRQRFRIGSAYWRRGRSVGAGPAGRWFENRFVAPYVRDSLLEHRVMVDTLETAAPWSGIEAVHDATRKAILGTIDRGGVRGFVGCHVSHIYREGASLYFTFLARMKAGEELAQYDAVKAAATRAIMDAGGRLSHHHGIGVEHARYVREALGEEAWQLLVSLKKTLDPKGIMNPGKIVPVGY